MSKQFRAPIAKIPLAQPRHFRFATEELCASALSIQAIGEYEACFLRKKYVDFGVDCNQLTILRKFIFSAEKCLTLERICVILISAEQYEIGAGSGHRDRRGRR